MKKSMNGQGSDTSHYFIDGFVSGSGTLGIVAFPNSFKGKDVEWMTFYMCNETGWGCQTYQFDGRSAVSQSINGDRSWWLLGKRGEIVQLGSEERRESIPDAGTGPGRYGYMNKIVIIGNDLYACGYARQVYRRTGDQWIHIDRGVLADVDSVGISFESMDGISSDNIYAVGLDGEIWHFDGFQWRSVNSPTNQHLFEVCCVTKDLNYAVGKSGVVVRGSGDQWEALCNPGFTDDLWGVVVFEDVVYVAGYGGIARIDGDEIIPVDTGLGRVIPSYRLRTGPPGVMWSIGNHDILRFDGTKWEEIICPDNV